VKALYYTAAILDGFIADENNALDWLFQFGGDPEGAGDTGFSDFMREVGVLAMGSTTYQWMLDHEVRPKGRPAKPWPYTQPTWVFSSREQPRVEGADLRFARGDVRPVHAEMVAAARGKNVWVMGGGDLVGQFHDHGLLDELIVGIAPVTLGRGAPLLPRRITPPPAAPRGAGYGRRLRQGPVRGGEAVGDQSNLLNRDARSAIDTAPSHPGAILGTDTMEDEMAVKPIPEGHQAVTPYLVIKGASAAIDYYKKVFGATERMRMDAPGGMIGHAELAVGGSVIMLADEFPDMGYRGPKAFGGSPVSLMLYVPNVDEVFKRAVDAGAKELRPVSNQFYGDRMGTLEDPFGHVWSIGTHVEDVPPEEMRRRSEEMMKQKA